MSDHSELLKDARELVDEVARIPPKPPPYRNLLEECASIMHLLVGVVEEHGKQQPTFDELLAAGRTCEETIKMFIAEYPCRQRDIWAELRAAGHLAKRAVEDADKVTFRESSLHIHSPTMPQGPPCTDDECEECVKASLARDAVRQIKTGDNDFVDLDKFKAAEADKLEGGAR